MPLRRLVYIMNRRNVLRTLGGTFVAGSGYYGLSLAGDGTPTGASSERDPVVTPTSSEGVIETTSPVDREWSEREGSVLLGVKPRSLDMRSLGEFERWQGRRCATVVTYADLGMSSEDIDWLLRLFTNIWETGHIPHLIWQPYLPTKETTADTVTADIAAGVHDETLQRWAQRLHRWLQGDVSRPNRRLYLNFAPEMNGDWIPWTSTGEATPEDYVAMWRHVHDTVLRGDLGATDVQWIWTVNHTTHSPDPIPAYYPGDAFVDWIGVHGYNAWGEWRPPSEVYGSALRTVRSIAEKPIALSEFGTTSRIDGQSRPSRKAEWIRRVFDYIETEQIRMACWFNEDKEYDWAVFGGEHGTDSVQYRGTTYRTYDAYRTAIERESVLPAYPEHPRIVTDREFTAASGKPETAVSDQD